MIEIHTAVIIKIVLAATSIALGMAIWVMLWVLLAFLTEYPSHPSWRTAVPAAAIVLLLAAILTKVIVFV
jgi:uncharacterized membrane protein